MAGFWSNVLSAVVFAGLGIGIYVGGLVVWDRVTPKYDIWRAIFVEKNLALAVLIGAFALGIAVIIGSAIHG